MLSVKMMTLIMMMMLSDVNERLWNVWKAKDKIYGILITITI